MSFWHSLFNYYFFLILTWRHFFTVFREKGGEREKHQLKREASHCSVAWTRDQTRNLGMCPGWESNLQPVSQGTMLQPTDTVTRLQHSPFKCTRTGTLPFKITTLIGLYLGAWGHTWTSGFLRGALVGVLKSHNYFPKNYYILCFHTREREREREREQCIFLKPPCSDSVP